VERNFVVASLREAEPATTVEPLVDFTTGYHSRNGGGDTVHTDGTLPVVDLSAVTPIPGSAPLITLRDEPTARPPFQVVLPAVLTIVLGPLTLLRALLALDRSAPTSERLLLYGVAVLAAISVVCAVRMLGRSVLSRRWLLLVSSVIVVADMVAYGLSEGPDLTEVYHAGVMILVVLALSSSAAAVWCNRNDPA
jgi:hypothetical protein